MPGSTIPRGNISYDFIVAPSITPVAVATVTCAEQNFTVQGLQVGDSVALSSNTAQTAGVGIVGARVSAANTLTVAFVNPTAGSVTPVAGIYTINVSRPENSPVPTVMT